MAATQSIIMTPTTISTPVEFSFSPFMEKQQQFDSFFSDSSIAALNNHRPLGNDQQQLLQNSLLLSPSSCPSTQGKFLPSSSACNGEFDQAFADLIAETPSTPIVGPAETPFLETQSNFSEEAQKKKPSPLQIPHIQHVHFAKPVQVDGCNQNLKTRQWQTVYVDPQFTNKLDVNVTSKTRCEEPSAEVPDKLYSSLKYEIRQTATGFACSTVPFLLGRITVVDASDFSEILKEKKSVLKGLVEGSLVRAPTCPQHETKKLEGSLKVQFTDVSYHHKKRGFCFQICYFTPSDLQRPILIKRSASFMVFARKPNQNKKRKREASETFELFQSKLEELVECSKKLKQTEQKNALEMISNKLLQLDPTFFIEQLQQMKKQM